MTFFIDGTNKDVVKNWFTRNKVDFEKANINFFTTLVDGNALVTTLGTAIVV